MAQKIAILREFKGLLGGTVTMLSQAIRALCMDDSFQIRELKAGGLFFAKRTLIGGYSFLKMRGIREYIATTIQFMLNF